MSGSGPGNRKDRKRRKVSLRVCRKMRRLVEDAKDLVSALRGGSKAPVQNCVASGWLRVPMKKADVQLPERWEKGSWSVVASVAWSWGVATRDLPLAQIVAQTEELVKRARKQKGIMLPIPHGSPAFFAMWEVLPWARVAGLIPSGWLPAPSWVSEFTFLDKVEWFHVAVARLQQKGVAFT